MVVKILRKVNKVGVMYRKKIAGPKGQIGMIIALIQTKKYKQNDIKIYYYIFSFEFFKLNNYKNVKIFFYLSSNKNF